MINYSPILTKLNVILLLSVCSFVAQAETLVKFQDIPLQEATTLGKKILVSFSAEWCLPCKVMDESIFSDEEISTLVNENFIPVKADLDSENGNNWNELYNANYLPTTLFALADGKEVERLNGVPSKEEFLAVLKEILAGPKIKMDSVVVPKPTHQTREKDTPIVSKYILQLGAFSTVQNANELIEQLEKKSHYNHTVVQESASNGKTFFKVVLIGYTTQKEAIASLVEVQRQGFDGFIKKL